LLSECVQSNISTTYPFFADEAVAEEVLSFMMKGGLEYAPVLHQEKLISMVSIMELLLTSQSKKINNQRLIDLPLRHTESIGFQEHLLDFFPRIFNFSGTVIPVTHDDGRYAGIIEKKTILEKISELFHLGKNGMTLELYVPSSRLKLSEVIAAFEKNDATVLSCGQYHAAPDGNGMFVTFRIQTHDWFRLLQNIEKYGYSISYSSTVLNKGEDELREKALEFIRLMDM